MLSWATAPVLVVKGWLCSQCWEGRDAAATAGNMTVRADNSLCNGCHGRRRWRSWHCGIIVALLQWCGNAKTMEMRGREDVFCAHASSQELNCNKKNINCQEQSNMSRCVSFIFCHDSILADCANMRTRVCMRHWISNSKKKLLNKWYQHEWDLSKMYKTKTKHISWGPHPQSMPQVRLLIFFTCPTIVSLGANQNSCCPGTGLPVEVKRIVANKN